MNDLTWFLYFVDVSQRVMPLVIAFGAMLALVGLVIPPKGVTMFSFYHKPPFPGVGRLKNVFIGWLVALVFAVMIPSEDTLYMMAASEGGEAVVLGLRLVPNYPTLLDYALPNLSGYMWLEPIGSSIERIRTDPFLLSKYFRLFYIFNSED